MLLEAGLETIQPGILPVYVLGDRVARILLDDRLQRGSEVSCGEVGEAEAPRNGSEQLGRIELLEEDACLNHAERVEVVLVEEVVVVGMFRFKRRVADRNSNGACCAVFCDIRDKLISIRAGDSASCDGTKRGVWRQRVTQLHTGQDVEIGRIVR